MRSFLFLLQVSRPIVWPVLPLVYALGLHAARVELRTAVFLQLALLTFPMNLIGCGLNDIYDFESDRRSARRKAIWGAVVHSQDRTLVWRASWAMVPLMIGGACTTYNAWNIAATVCLVLMAWLYSVPPIRFKERPPLDAFANGLGFFLLPFTMGYSLGAAPPAMPTRYYLLALCVCGIHALATAADYDADKAAGHRTFAVALGRRRALAFACATFVTAWLWGNFQGLSVRVFLLVGSAATLVAAVFPVGRVIATACSIVFGGFLIAAIWHIFLS